MTVERLEELKDWLNDDVANLDLGEYYSDIYVKDECKSELSDLTNLIDAEIDRQSVTDEDVKKAIGYLSDFKTVIKELNSKFVLTNIGRKIEEEQLDSIDLAIRALKNWRPRGEE